MCILQKSSFTKKKRFVAKRKILAPYQKSNMVCLNIQLNMKSLNLNETFNFKLLN